MNSDLSRRTLLSSTGIGLGTLLTGALTAQAAQAAPSPSLDSGPGPGWSLVESLSDDFSDAARSRALWHRGLWYPASGPGRFVDENVSVEDEQLRLHATESEGDAEFDYHYASVESTIDIPGVASYVEIRAKVLPSAANVLSAFWLQSSNHRHGNELLEGAEPNPEIDVLETFRPGRLDSALHVWPDNTAATHVAFGGNSWPTGIAELSEQFHTYGIERRDGVLRFTFDGRLAWEVDTYETREDGSWRWHPSLSRMSRHVCLSLEGHLGLPVPEHLPASFDIDHVRTYYYTGGDRAPAGHYRIACMEGERLLAVTADGEVTTADPVDDSVETVWELTETAEHTYTLISQDGRFVLSLADGSAWNAAAGTEDPVEVIARHDGPIGLDARGSRSRWHVQRAEISAATLPGATHTWQLRSAFTGYNLGSRASSALGVQQQEHSRRPSQAWRLLPIDSGA